MLSSLSLNHQLAPTRGPDTHQLMLTVDHRLIEAQPVNAYDNLAPAQRNRNQINQIPLAEHLKNTTLMDLDTRTNRSSAISTYKGQSSTLGDPANLLLNASDTKDRVALESNHSKAEILFTRNDPKIKHKNRSRKFNINKETRRRHILVPTSGVTRSSSVFS